MDQVAANYENHENDVTAPATISDYPLHQGGFGALGGVYYYRIGVDDLQSEAVSIHVEGKEP